MNKNFLNCSPRDKRRILGKASHLAKTNLQRAREYEDTDDYDYEVEAEVESLPKLNVEVAASSTTLETTEVPQAKTTHTPIDDSAALRGSTAGEELVSDEIGFNCQSLAEDNTSNEDSSLQRPSTDSVSPNTPQANTRHTLIDESASHRDSPESTDVEYIADEIVLDCQPLAEDNPSKEAIPRQFLSIDSSKPDAPQASITRIPTTNTSADPSVGTVTEAEKTVAYEDSPDSNSTSSTTETSSDTKVIEAVKADESLVPVVTKPPAQENAEPLDVEIEQTDSQQTDSRNLLPVNKSFNPWLSNEIKADSPEPAQTLRPSTGASGHGKKQVDESLTRFQIAEKIADKYPLRQLNEDKYLCQHGKCPCYSIPSFSDLRTLVFDTFTDICMKKDSTSYIRSIVDALEFFVPKINKDEVEENERRYIATLNCIIDLRDYSVLPLSPEIFIRHYLNVKYDPYACYYPEFKKFLETATDGDEDLEEAIWEMMAYLLFPSEFQKAFFVLIGPAHSGKSSLLDLIQSFFPDEDVSNVTLQEFGGNFTSGSIAEARINIEGDLPRTPITRKGMSEIKKITGGDRIMANKKYVQAYACKPKTKLLFASNFPLEIACKDDAFLKRMHILPFTVVIPDEEQDKELFGKLQKEKSAIFNEVYKRYIKLRSNGFRFTCCDSGEDNLVFSKTESESVDEIIRAFFDKYLEYTGDRSDFTATAEISELFRKYCTETGNKQYIQGFDQAFSKFIKQSSMDEIIPVRRGPKKAHGYCALKVAKM